MQPKYMSQDEIEAYAKVLEEPERSRFFELIIEEFESTDNSVKRNSLAMLLTDYDKEMAVEPIIRMIKHPKTYHSRGTLLYALNELDYSEHIEYLFTLIFDDSFEVKREAFLLIETAIEHNWLDIHNMEKQEDLIAKTIEQLKGDKSDKDFYISVLELFQE